MFKLSNLSIALASLFTCVVGSGSHAIGPPGSDRLTIALPGQIPDGYVVVDVISARRPGGPPGLTVNTHAVIKKPGDREKIVIDLGDGTKSPIPSGYVVTEYIGTPKQALPQVKDITHAIIKKPGDQEKIALPSPIPDGYVIIQYFETPLPGAPLVKHKTHALIKKTK